MRNSVIALLLTLASPLAYASFFDDYMIDPEDGMLDASRYLSEVPLGFLPVPVLITEPAVGAGLGVMGIFFHESEEQRKQRITQASKHAILPSNISMLGIMGTENGTKGVGGGHLGFWLQDTLRYKGFAVYPDLNLDFYSIAGYQLPNPVELNLTGPIVLQELKYRLGSTRWMAGGWQLYRHVDTELANQIALQNPLIPPAATQILQDHLQRDITTSGLGAVMEYDSRDNPLAPQTGFQYYFLYSIFDDAIGSDVEYDSYQIKGLNYWELNEQFNLGFRLQLDGVESDDAALPAFVPPFIDLRGIPKSRYQGNAVAVVEAEVTWKYNYRWRFNAFTGAGWAANELDDLSTTDTESTFGGGFRYLVAKRYGFVMGADIARGPEETAFYIQAGASWR